MGVPTVFASLLAIYHGYLALEEKLVEEYGALPGPKMTSVLDWYGRIVVVAGKIAISLVAGLLLAHLWVFLDPEGAGKNLRRLYNGIPAWRRIYLEAVTLIPSCSACLGF